MSSLPCASPMPSQVMLNWLLLSVRAGLHGPVVCAWPVFVWHQQGTDINKDRIRPSLIALLLLLFRGSITVGRRLVVLNLIALARNGWTIRPRGRGIPGLFGGIQYVWRDFACCGSNSPLPFYLNG